jgi:nucleotide-binding universal stress UspA family protein
VTAPILVAFSPESADRGPVNFAVGVGRLTGAPLVVVAVGHGAGDMSAHASLASDLRARDVSATVRAVEHGNAAYALADAAKEIEPSLVVVGSTRRSKLGRVLLGTTASHLMSGSQCPVVVVPRGHELHADRVRRVGAAFVPTDEGRDALRTAALLARSAGARLEAVMVLSPKHAGEQSPGMMARAHHDVDAAEGPAARDHLAAEEALREALAASAPDLGVEPDILFQDSADGLIAASEGLDLLVMGSAAHGPAGAVALGGVARRVTASSGCPVLVLPRDAADRIEALVPRAKAKAAG